MKKSRKTFALIAACLMLVVGVVGGTVAWLTATTGSVVNTFTCGDINITLTETPATYKIVPGNNIAKDPKVTVLANSEDCILFVKVEEENWPTFTETNGTRKVRYEIADGWTALTGVSGVSGVYFRTVTSSESNQDFAVLKDNTITVSGNLTKVEVNSMTPAPTLTITAYAHQLAKGDSSFTRATAWANLNPTT